MARKTVASAAEVRAFAATKGVETGTRGRLSKSLIEDFEKETGKRVATGYRPAKTVEVNVTKTDKAGRKRTRKVSVPMHEARAQIGRAHV